MYLFETMRINNNRVENLRFHNERLNNSRKNLFGIKDEIDVSRLFGGIQKDENRLRVIYSADSIRTEITQYTPRVINSLKCIRTEQFDYSHKYLDRSILTDLSDKKADCDEIIIIINDIVTDTTISNIVFFDGVNYLTPDTPLLKGTKRRELLEKGIIKEARITINDIKHFAYATLINAMLELNEIVIPVNKIF